jgi:hypothetical protein
MSHFKIATLLSLLFLSACGDVLSGNPRDESFYRPVISEMNAPNKVEMIKAKLIYSDQYPMRLALFGNQKFFYEIDELGDGWGEWKMEDGFVKLFAPRNYFDMRLVLSGADKKGDAKILRFRDRSGVQSIAVSLRDPDAARAAGRSLPALRRFTKSTDGI